MAVSTILSSIPAGRGHNVLCSMMDLSDPPADYYFTRLVFALNGAEITRLELGPAMADHPTLGIHLASLTPGDRISAAWHDSGGRHDAAERVYSG